MYLHPFLAGVLGTVTVELIVLFIVAIKLGRKRR